MLYAGSVLSPIRYIEVGSGPITVGVNPGADIRLASEWIERTDPAWESPE